MSKKRSTDWNPEWIGKCEKGELWLKASSKGPQFCFCSVCNVHIKTNQSGLGAAKQHSLGNGHKSNMSSIASSVTRFFQPVDIDTTKSTLQKQVMSAELKWVLHTVESNKSFHCEDDVAELFRSMFPSAIAEKFSCGRDKAQYLLMFAIFPYIRKQMIENLKPEFFSTSYDESEGKMGVVVRSVDMSTGSIKVHLLDIITMEEFSAKASSECILKAVDDACLCRSLWIGDESDNCSTMRGCKQGVTVRLRQERGLESLIDLGGCTLHIVHNGNRHATQECFQYIVGLVEDVFYLFKKSLKKTKLFEKIQKELNVVNHKMLRHVEVRWLCLLPCLERIDEQYESLCALASHYMNEPNVSDRQKRIADLLKSPTTRVTIKFLIHLLKISSVFERWLQQSESILVHVLRPQLIKLLENILVQFIKLDVIKESKPAIYGVSIELKNCVSTQDMLIGSETKSLVGKLSEGLQQQFLFKVRSTYIRLALYLQKNLPFDNACLKSVQFLDLSTNKPVNEIKVVNLAKRLPRVVPECQLDALRSEVRLFNLLPTTIRPTSSSECPTAAAWHQVRQLKTVTGEQQFPLFARLSAAASTLFHGNADVERVFGKMHDIDQNDKRNRMSEETRRALLVVKTYLTSNKVKAAKFEINSDLLDLAFKARSEFAQYKKKRETEETIRINTEKAKEEEAQMRELIIQDKQRKSNLAKLKEKERQHEEKIKEAQRVRLEAEATLQKAIGALASASDKEKILAKEHSGLLAEKSSIELKAVDKALKVASQEKVMLKRTISLTNMFASSSKKQKKA